MTGHDELIARIGEYLSEIMQAVIANDTKEWLQVDLTIVQLRALFVLATTGPLTIGLLAQKLGIHYTVVSRVAGRLVQSGLIERYDDPGDRRRTLVCPTAAGDVLAKQLLQGRRTQFLNITTELSEGDLVALHQGLKALAAAFVASSMPPGALAITSTVSPFKEKSRLGTEG